MGATNTTRRTVRSSVSIIFGVGLLLLAVREASSSATAQTDGAGSGSAGLYAVRGSVMLNDMGANAKVKPDQIRVILSLEGGQRRESAMLMNDGGFEIEDVPAGTHLLEVFAIGLQFPQYRVDVSGRNGGRLRVSPVENKRFVLREPLVLQPILKDIEYYEVRENYVPHATDCKKPADFSLAFVWKNPMILMMIVMVLFVFVVPKLVDPEQMKEMQREMQQLQQQNQQQQSAGGARRRISQN